MAVTNGRNPSRKPRNAGIAALPSVVWRVTSLAGRPPSGPSPPFFLLLVYFAEVSTVRLGRIIRGTNLSPVDEGTYCPPDFLRDALKEYIASQGEDSEISVELFGQNVPFGTIFITRRCEDYKGPLSGPPQAVEGKDERVVLEWFESKGNASSSLHPPHTTFSPRPQDSARETIGGISSSNPSNRPNPSKTFRGVVLYRLTLRIVVILCTLNPAFHNLGRPLSVHAFVRVNPRV